MVGDRKGIRPLNLAPNNTNIKMESNQYGRGTAQSTPWASPLAYVKQDSGGPGGTVGRRNSTNEGAKPDEPRGCQLRIGSVNVGTLARRSGEVEESRIFVVCRSLGGRERVQDC